MKELVISLINRYEEGSEYLSEIDVMEELEYILEDSYKSEDSEMYIALEDAIREFVIQRHEAELGGGRVPDGGDEFIEAIKRIVDFD